MTWHGGKLDLTADKRRDRMLRRIGINSTRVTDEDVRHRLPSIIEDLRVIFSRTDAGFCLLDRHKANQFAKTRG